MRSAALDRNSGAQPRSPWLVSKLPLVPALWLLAAAWLLLWFVHGAQAWDPAAWLHLVFARSLARGEGFRFQGTTVYGEAAPLWAWLLVLTHVLTRNWLVAGKALSALATVVALSGAYRYARVLTWQRGRAASRVFAAAIVLLLAVNPIVSAWAFSGLPVLLAAGLIFWGLAMATGVQGKPASGMALVLGCLCAGLLPLLQPETILFTVLLALLLFVRWIALPLPFRPKLLCFLAGWLLVVGPPVGWAVYAARTFGSVLPNALAAGVAAPHESVLAELLGDYATGFPLLLFGLAALGFWYVRHSTRRYTGAVDALDELLHGLDASGRLPLLWAALVGLFYVLHHSAVRMPELLLTAPVLTVAVLAVLFRQWERGFLVAAVFGVLIGAGFSLLAGWPLVANVAAVTATNADLARALRPLPPQEPVALASPGEVAFLSTHPIVDMSGLLQPGVLPLRWDVADVRRLWWAHEQGARFLLLDHPPEPGSVPVWRGVVPETGWAVSAGQFRSFDRLQLWRLPPSPTVPLPPDMPVSAQP